MVALYVTSAKDLAYIVRWTKRASKTTCQVQLSLAVHGNDVFQLYMYYRSHSFCLVWRTYIFVLQLQLAVVAVNYINKFIHAYSIFTFFSYATYKHSLPLWDDDMSVCMMSLWCYIYVQVLVILEPVCWCGCELNIRLCIWLRYKKCRGWSLITNIMWGHVWSSGTAQGS